MKMTIAPIVIVAFGTITKSLSKCLEDLEVDGRVETILYLPNPSAWAGYDTRSIFLSGV